MSADAAVRDEWPAPLEFISEDDLRAFEEWLEYQAIDLAALTAEEAAAVGEMFDDAAKRRETARKVGRMKLKRPGESRTLDVSRLRPPAEAGAAAVILGWLREGNRQPRRRGSLHGDRGGHAVNAVTKGAESDESR
jgi:hypothetical protein